MSHNILIVEDDPSMRAGLEDNLQYEGYQTLCADNGKDGLVMAFEEELDLLLLDIMLPEMDGITLCRRLRESGSTLPVIMLTARGDEIDKVVGLEIGADDYMSKPFSIRELLARIRSQLRRAEMTTDISQRSLIGDSVFNLATSSLTVGGKQAEIGQSEAEILHLLVERRGRVITRDDFISIIGSGNRFSNTRTLDNCIVKLRRLLEKNPAQPLHLVTVHGAGYKLLG